MLLKLATRLEMFKQDRGEGPVPHIIMIAVISAGALVIATALIAVANGWLAKVPR